MDVKNFIWYERYRPKELSEMVLPQAYREKFEEYVEEQNIPHLLFHGPAGSGKTTMAQILMSKIQCHSMVLNASSKDRGIDTIKGKVREFASSQPLVGHLKIVFLDEADGLTPDAQIALKNTVETYSKSCRFIFTANAPDRIKREIKSRCSAYEFRQYSKKKLLKRLNDILDVEKVKASTEDVTGLIEKFYPDIRSILNNLQAGSVKGKFDPNLIASSSVNIEDVLSCIKAGKVMSLRKLWTGLTEFTWVYRTLFDDFLGVEGESAVDHATKAEIADIIAEFMYRDAMVSDREINVTACCLRIMKELGCRINFHT
jgi:replication factor C small subunit